MSWGAREVLWLRVRHLRTRTNRFLNVAGTDLDESTSLTDRMYLLYIAVIIVVWAFLSWNALMGFTARGLTLLSPDTAGLLLATLPLVPAVICLVPSIRALLTSPYKMTEQDIAYLGSDRECVRTAIFLDAARGALGYGVVGALVGILVVGGLNPTESAVPIIATCALAMMAGRLLPWVIGLSRVSPTIRPKALALSVSCLLLAMAIGSAFIPLAVVVASPKDELMAAACRLEMPAATALGCGIAAEWAAIVLIAPLTSIVSMIDESEVYAETMAIRSIALVSPRTYTQIIRRRKNERRGPLTSLRIGMGRGALLSHTTLSAIRRFEGLGDVLVWSAIIVPAGMPFVLGFGPSLLLLPWMLLIIRSSGKPHEMSRVFDDDEGNRMLRSNLPFGPLTLLAIDSLPTLAVACVGSTVGCVLTLGAFGNVGTGIVLSLLIDVGTVVCGGLAVVIVPFIYRKIWFEASLLLLVGTVAATPTLGSATISAAIAAVLIAAGMAGIAFGRD